MKPPTVLTLLRSLSHASGCDQPGDTLMSYMQHSTMGWWVSTVACSLWQNCSRGFQKTVWSSMRPSRRSLNSQRTV